MIFALGAVVDISPNDHMGPALSLLLVIVLFVGLVYALIRALSEIRGWRRDGRAADQAARPDAVLVEGEGYVHGVVELDEGTDFAVVIEVRQVGTERKGSKGGWRHSWMERERRSFTNRFWIRHASGARVRVDPGDHVDLIDRLDVTVQDESRTERYLIAELSVGESVIAKGVLTSEATPGQGKTYREAAPRTWVLKHQPGRSRLQFTAEKLGDHHRRMAMTFIKRLVFGWLPCTLVVAAACGPYMTRIVAGETTSIVVTSKDYRPRHGKTAAQHLVAYIDPGGSMSSENLDDDDWATVSVGTAMALVDVPSFREVNLLGANSTLHVMSWIFAFFSTLICFTIVLVPPKKPWYQTKNWNHTGGGRLADPKRSTRHVYSRDS